MKIQHLHKGYWALAAISFFWGTTWFVSKLTIKDIPPLQMTGMRQSLAGCLMIAYFLMKTKKLPTLRELAFHLLIGFLLISCSNGLTTWAIKYIPSFLGALIACLMPFVLILANSFFFHEKVKPKLFIALLIGFSGVAVLLLSFVSEFKADHFVFGIVLSLISVLTWTSGTLISAKNKLQINPFEGIGWQMLLGGIVLLIASKITGQNVPLHTIPLQAWIYFLYLTFIGSILCFVCYLYALKTLPLSMVSVYVYVNPIVALLLGVVFLNEKISLQIMIGIAITFSGIYLVRQFNKK
ncbi:MAG: EamA family transporter [Bacteroidetes bacterium]|nr:EamA family transporter [Bacteroidota bacterium]